MRPPLDVVSSTRHILEPGLALEMCQTAARGYGKISSVCPYPVRERRNGMLMQRRCGQCACCNVNRRKEIVGRSLAEAIQTPSVCLTLTLSDQNISTDWYDADHWTREIRNLKLRLSRRFGWTPKIRWTAELGGETDRPHVHALIFNVPSTMVPVRQLKMQNLDFWRYGHSTVDQVTHSSAQYVVEYITDKEKKGTILKSRASPNIGRKYLDYWIKCMSEGRKKHGARFRNYPNLKSGLLKRSAIEIEHKLYPLDQHWRKIVQDAGLLDETSTLGAHLRTQLNRAGEIIEHGGPVPAQKARETVHQREQRAKRERTATTDVWATVNGYKVRVKTDV